MNDYSFDSCSPDSKSENRHYLKSFKYGNETRWQLVDVMWVALLQGKEPKGLALFLPSAPKSGYIVNFSFQLKIFIVNHSL